MSHFTQLTQLNWPIEFNTSHAMSDKTGEEQKWGLTVMGLEPTFSDPKSDALPLSYTASWYPPPVKGWNRALLYEYLTVLLQQNGRSYRYVKRFTRETCTQRSRVITRHFFSPNLRMRDIGLPQGTILHPLSVPKVRQIKRLSTVKYDQQIHIREF